MRNHHLLLTLFSVLVCGLLNGPVGSSMALAQGSLPADTVNGCLRPRWGEVQYFGSGVGLDFRTQPPTLLPEGPFLGSGGASTLCTPEGEPWLSTDPTGLITADGVRYLTYTPGSPPPPEVIQQQLILPWPGSPARALALRTTPLRPHAQRDSAQLIAQLVAPDTDPELAAPPAPDTLHPDVAPRLAALRHADGCSYWIVAHERASTRLLAWRFNENGLQQPAVASLTRLNYAGQSAPAATAGRLASSADGRWCAHGLRFDDQSGQIEVLHFDPRTGRFTTVHQLHVRVNLAQQLEAINGLAFSPNGRFLYACLEIQVVGIHLTRLVQYDLLAPDINASRSLLTELSGTVTSPFWSDLVPGPDGRLYMSGPDTRAFLHVLDQPNEAGPASGFTRNAIALDTGRVFRSLWNLPAFLGDPTPVRPASLAETICPGDAVPLEVEPQNPCRFTYHWLRDGSPLEGQTRPRLTARVPGRYQAVIEAASGCRDTATFHLNRDCPPDQLSECLAPRGGELQYFGQGNGWDFGNTPPLPLSQGALTSQYAAATATNPRNGRLHFYTDGDAIFNRLHERMAGHAPQTPPAGVDSGNTAGLVSQTLVLPFPGSHSRYLLLAAHPENGACQGIRPHHGLRYSYIDMTGDGGLGSVEATHNRIPVYCPVAQKLTATPDTGSGYWIVTHQAAGAQFILFRLSENGFRSSQPQFRGPTQLAYDGTEATTRGVCVFSPDGRQLVHSILGQDGQHRIELMFFDARHGTLQTDRILELSPNGTDWVFERPCGLSFDPQGQQLYVHTVARHTSLSDIYQSRILQLDLDLPIPEAAAYEVWRTTGPHDVDGNLLLAPNQRLYFRAVDSPQHLHVIGTPNARAEACGFQAEALELNAGRAWGVPASLPAFQARRPRPYLRVEGEAVLCNQPSIRLHVEPKHPEGTYRWFWNGNLIPGATAPTLDAVAPGTYRAEIAPLRPCLESTAPLRVRLPEPLPNLQIRGPSSVLCNGEEARLEIPSLDSTAYQWFRNDTPIPEATLPLLHTREGGTYRVQLTTPDGCLVEPEPFELQIQELPKPTISGPRQVCSGRVIQLRTEPPEPGQQLQWIRNDRPIQGANQPILNILEGGRYTVQLEDQLGCIRRSTPFVVTAAPAPVAELEFSDTVICTDRMVTAWFRGTAEPDAEFHWSFGGLPQPERQGRGPHNISWSQAGRWTIRLIIEQGNCRDTAVSEITTTRAPDLQLTLDRTRLCRGASTPFRLTDDEGNPIPGPYFAQCTGCQLIQQQPPALPHLLWTRTGRQTVQLAVPLPGCTVVSPEVEVEVSDPPPLDFGLAPHPPCTGRPLTLGLTGAEVDEAHYQWQVAGAETNTFTGPGPHTVSWAQPGTYDITLTADRNGCRDSLERTFDLRRGPLAIIQAERTTVCLGETLQVRTPSTPGATYAWSCTGCGGNPGFPDAPTLPTLQWQTPGTRTLRLTVRAEGCETVADPRTFTVVEYPEAEIFAEQRLLCLGDTGVFSALGSLLEGATLDWQFGGGQPSRDTGTGPHFIVWDRPGTYPVQLNADRQGCRDTARNTVVVRPVPLAQTRVSPASICAGESVSLALDHPPQSGTQYVWSCLECSLRLVGPGPHQARLHEPGTFRFELEARGSICTARTRTGPLEVKVRPQPLIILESNRLCSADSLQLRDQGDAPAGTVRIWQFSGGQPATFTGNPPPAVRWPDSEAREVRIGLTLTTPGQCTTAWDTLIRILPQPEAAFTLNRDQVCVGDTVLSQLAMAPESGTSYLWACDGCMSPPTGNGPHTLRWLQPGIKTVSLTATAAGCTTTAPSDSVAVLPGPETEIAPLDSVVCIGQRSRLDVTAPQPETAYTWIIDADHLERPDTLEGPGPWTYVWAKAGRYEVRLSASAGNCTTEQVYRIVARPIPPLSFQVSDSVVCNQQAVTVVYGGDTSSIPGAQYIWNCSGCSTPPEGPGPHLIRWSRAGTYTVDLTLIYGPCTASARPRRIVVRPYAVFAYDIERRCDRKLHIERTATSDLEFRWDWGDGNVTLQPELAETHRYDEAGAYAVVLRASGEGVCTRQDTVEVEIPEAPQAIFDLRADACPQAYWLRNQSVQRRSWWLVEGRRIETASDSIRYTFRDTGAVSVTLVVEDSVLGCRDTATLMHRVEGLGPLRIEGVDSISCQLTIQPEPPVHPSGAYLWRFGDGNTSDVDRPTHTYSQPGTYTLQLDLNPGGRCEQTLEQTVRVLAIPTLAFEAEAVCRQRVVLDNQSVNAQAFRWVLGDGRRVVADTDRRIVAYPEPGTYRLALEANPNTPCRVDQDTTVMVFPAVTAAFTYEPQPCPLELRVDNQSRHAQTYQWELGGAPPADTVTRFLYTLPDTGSYDLRLIARDTVHGCSDTSSARYVARNPAEALFTASVDTCHQTVRLISSSQAAFSSRWTLGDGTTLKDTVEVRHRYDRPGTYAITLEINGNTACRDTVGTRVTLPAVSPLPVEIAVEEPACTLLTVFRSSVRGQRYRWWIGSVRKRAETELVYQFEQPGTYPVELTVWDAQGCPWRDTLDYTFDPEERREIIIPNLFSPNGDGDNDVFRIGGAVGACVASFEVFDRSGRRVFRSQGPEDVWDGRIDGQRAPAGTYFYTVQLAIPNQQPLKRSGYLTLVY